MTAQQLNWIRQKKAEFFHLFKTELIIDIPRMNGVESYRKGIYAPQEEMEEVLKLRLTERGGSLEKLQSKTQLSDTSMRKERLALFDYFKDISENNWQVTEAMKLVNKDRSLFYYYKNIIP